jgi:hypothetical protein
MKRRDFITLLDAAAASAFLRNTLWQGAMTLQSMSFIFGAILLAVAILGGGFEIKEIKVSNVGIGVRALAGIVGLFYRSRLLAAAIALPFDAPVTSGTDAPRVPSRPPPRPAEALLPRRRHRRDGPSGTELE